MRFQACPTIIVLLLPVWALGSDLHTPSSAPLQPVSPLPYHNTQTLVCTDCHNMHFSMSHDASGGPSQDPSGSPSKSMLKEADPLDVCLSCHEGHGGVPDVVGADANGLDDRAGGFFSDSGGMNFKGHNLGRNLPPLCDRCHGRDQSSAAVTCIDCHDPHGNGRPRNLRWASMPGSEPQFGLLVDPSASGMARYSSSAVAYSSTNSDSLREVTSICIDCHHGFSGSASVGPAGGHVRHTSYDSERGSTNSISDGASKHVTSPEIWSNGTGLGFEGTERLRFLMNGATTFAAARTVDPATNGVFCLTCHKAHGSNEAFGLTWIGNSTGCRQCHEV